MNLFIRICKGMLKLFMMLSLFTNGVFASSQEGESKTYKISGKIEQISTDRFSVDDGEKVIQFNRKNGKANIPPDAAIGDQITVWYSVIPKGFVLTKNPKVHRRQAPGQVAPSHRPTQLDDRAIYFS